MSLSIVFPHILSVETKVIIEKSRGEGSLFFLRDHSSITSSKKVGIYKAVSAREFAKDL